MSVFVDITPEESQERRAERRDQLLQRVGLEGTTDRKIWEIIGGLTQHGVLASWY